MYKEDLSNNSLILVIKLTMKLLRSCIKEIFNSCDKVNNESIWELFQITLYY